MPDPLTIAKEYAQREAAAGGLANADPKEVAQQMARDMGLPWETVREALVTAWCGGFAG